MPLAREQRASLARVLKWARSNGWVHLPYPHTWRRRANRTYVQLDRDTGELAVDHLSDDPRPRRMRMAVVPVDSPERALNVLAALDLIPVELAPLGDARRHRDQLESIARVFDVPADFLNTGPAAEPIYVQDALPGMPPAEDDDPFDGPASFADAGQAFADWVDGRISPDLAAETLSRLAREGLIVSVTYHDETCGWQADLPMNLGGEL